MVVSNSLSITYKNKYVNYINCLVEGDYLMDNIPPIRDETCEYASRSPTTDPTQKPTKNN